MAIRFKEELVASPSSKPEGRRQIQAVNALFLQRHAKRTSRIRSRLVEKWQIDFFLAGLKNNQHMRAVFPGDREHEINRSEDLFKLITARLKHGHGLCQTARQ